MTCAAGVFVLGRYCPCSGESCRCPEVRRAVYQHRKKCHLPGMLLAPSMRKARPPHCLSAGQHSPIQAMALCWGSPAAARKFAGQCVCAGGNVIFPARFLPRVCPIARLPMRSQTKTPPSSGENRQRAACCFYQAAEELSSSLLVWDSASSGFSGSVVSGSAVSSSSGI